MSRICPVCLVSTEYLALEAALTAATARAEAAEAILTAEPSPEMIEAGLSALAEWRKTLDRDEAMMRSYMEPNGKRFIASATPAEKMAIRWKAMAQVALATYRASRKDGAG
jgi:hypothetical protein